MKIEVNVPDGESGDWKIDTFEISQAESDRSRIRSWRPGEFVEAGTYKRLRRKGTVVMSNTKMEIDTHRELFWQVEKVEGHVLLNGLGLGMALTQVLKNPKITKVTVIENSEDVIKLVAPSFTSDPRVEIIHADAFTYQPPKGTQYVAVWHDIWDDICTDNHPEMKTLCRKYGRRTEWQECWGRYE